MMTSRDCDKSQMEIPEVPTGEISFRRHLVPLVRLEFCPPWHQNTQTQMSQKEEGSSLITRESSALLVARYSSAAEAPAQTADGSNNGPRVCLRGSEGVARTHRIIVIPENVGGRLWTLQDDACEIDGATAIDEQVRRAQDLRFRL
jgi:hypothetical protein